MYRVAALIVALTLMTGRASAWEAGREGALCTLTHTNARAVVRLTYDPALPLYTISLTTPEPWPAAPVFAMIFEGAQPNTITTDRHELSPDRRMVSVADRGFGNVLDGLQFNATAIAVSGGALVELSLEGAAAEVAAFRACGTVPTA